MGNVSGDIIKCSEKYNEAYQSAKMDFGSVHARIESKNVLEICTQLSAQSDSKQEVQVCKAVHFSPLINTIFKFCHMPL